MFIAIKDYYCRKGETVQKAWDELVDNGEASEDEFDAVEFYQLSEQLKVERTIKIVEKTIVRTPESIRK